MSASCHESHLVLLPLSWLWPRTRVLHVSSCHVINYARCVVLCGCICRFRLSIDRWIITLFEYRLPLHRREKLRMCNCGVHGSQKGCDVDLSSMSMGTGHGRVTDHIAATEHTRVKRVCVMYWWCQVRCWRDRCNARRKEKRNAEGERAVMWEAGP